MKGFFIGIILGAIGGMVGGYFGLARGPRDRVHQLTQDNEDLRKQKGEARAKTEETEKKLAEAEDAARKVMEDHAQELKKLQDDHEAELQRLQGDVAAARGEAKNLRERVNRLREETRIAKAATGSVPVVAKLVTLRDAHRPIEVAVARDLNLARMLLSRARKSIPEMEELRSVKGRLREKTTKLGESVRRLYSYVSRNSRALKEAGADPVGQMIDLSIDEFKLLEGAVEAVIDTVEGMRSNRAQVFAEKEWQDCDASARKGDYVCIKGLRKSNWRMRSGWGPKKGEDAIGGWDMDYQSKIHPDSRSGALIMRIGLSEEIWPAYLGKPVIADENGAISCRMNDKLPDGNWGKVFIEITTLSGERLDAALAAIDEALKGVAWLKW